MRSDSKENDENLNFSMIMAYTPEGIIGKDNKMPWHIPEDLQNFRKITTNNIVVMGRKTFESLPNGKLPNRINIIVTKFPEKYIEETQLQNQIEKQDIYFTNKNL